MPTATVPLEQSPSATLPRRRLDRRRGRVVRVTVLFVACVCIALMAMNAWLIARAHTAEIQQINQANSNLARSVSQQIEATIALAEHVIAGVAFELERADMTMDAIQRMQPVLVNHVSKIPGIKGLFVYDEQGHWLVHSEPFADISRNNSDRDYFIHHKNNQSARTLIGAPIVSRSSGEWVIPVSLRINAPDGSFAGVVLATLSMTHLRATLDKFQIGEQGAIAIFQTDRLLMRRPFKEEDLGRRNVNSPIVKIFQATRSGTIEAVSTIDGVLRIISFEHLSNYPVFVTVAVGKEEVLRDWKSASVYQSIWAVLLCGAVAAAGSYLVGSMRRRLRAESRLRSTRDELTQANDRLAHLADEDGLTGLANRRHFDARLAQAFQQGQQDQVPLAVVMVDVDDFKKYNDFYGHLQGDECLRRIADALRSSVGRTGDLVARYGGEEMVLLLPARDAQDAAAIAEAARTAVQKLHLPHVGVAPGFVSISLGVAACMPQANTGPFALLKAADDALYSAKMKGKNVVEVALSTAV